MEELRLLRITKQHDVPQMGVLMYKDAPLCVTLERPWVNNEPEISCIPEGEYICFKRLSQRAKGMTFEVGGVPGRSAILFHPGN